MSTTSYRGYEIHPLIFPHRTTQPGRARNYDEGFDAAVRICRRDSASALTLSQVFKVRPGTPFDSLGQAQRASALYAENMIDSCERGEKTWQVA